MSKAGAKFFCENCGSEVPKDAKMCRHCGRFFSSVRCPVCGTTGSNQKFANGCPNCGYAVGKGTKNNTKLQKEKKAGRASKKHLKDAINSRNPVTFEKRHRTDGSLPGWSILLITAILACFIAGSAKYLGIF